MSYSNMPATSFEASQQIKQIKFNHDMYLYIVSNNGHFPLDQKCWFQFLVKTSDTRNLRRAFPGISGKKRTLPRKKKTNFWKFLSGKFCSIWFSSRNANLPFKEINNFWIFWKFSGDIIIPFAPVLKVSEVLVEWKATTVYRWYRLQIRQQQWQQLYYYLSIYNFLKIYTHYT